MARATTWWSHALVCLVLLMVTLLLLVLTVSLLCLLLRLLLMILVGARSKGVGAWRLHTTLNHHGVRGWCLARRHATWWHGRSNGVGECLEGCLFTYE